VSELITTGRRKTTRAVPVITDKFQATYRKTTLPNGIRVVSETIPHVRSVSIGVWIHVGSRDERASTNGISHFIEHMVFKGTERRSVREIAQSIESVGGYLNAFTGKEHTCYYARVLDEHAPLALDVIADMVLHPLFPEKELEKERGVIIEELKNAEDDPEDIIHDYFDKAIFGSHPLGFPVIGNEPNLRRFTRNDLLTYFRKHYVAHNIVVAAAGNLQHEYLVDLVEREFEKAPRRAQTNGSERRKPTKLGSGRFEHPKPIQQAHVCLGTSTFGVRDQRRYTLMTLNTLLGEGMSSRLYQNIREKYGFAYSVYSYVNLLSDMGAFAAYIGTDQSHVERSIELIVKELEKLKTKPVGQSELERTKAQLKGSMMLSLESMPSRMMRLGSSELYFGELMSLDSIVKEIDAVTSEQIYRLANDLFNLDDFCTVIIHPTGKHDAH
jgi:predicted Zn-dependent peptidase